MDYAPTSTRERAAFERTGGDWRFAWAYAYGIYVRISSNRCYAPFRTSLMTHVPPKHHADAFHCPNCGVYANQLWGDCEWARYQTRSLEGTDLTASKCAHCQKFAYWYRERLTIPDVRLAEPASTDLPSECRADYEEAANIANVSPRGAAALLRLCIQKLLVHLGQTGKNINGDIAQLVKDGLPPLVQRSLDICRVVGNNAVHPGELDLQDTPDVAFSLFKLINVIAYDRITRPKEIEALYNALPDGARDAITNRDGA